MDLRAAQSLFTICGQEEGAFKVLLAAAYEQLWKTKRRVDGSSRATHGRRSFAAAYRGDVARVVTERGSVRLAATALEQLAKAEESKQQPAAAFPACRPPP